MGDVGSVVETKSAKGAVKGEAKQARRESGTRQLMTSAADVIAGATWLMMASPAHRHLFLTDLEWLLMPPLQFQQFRLFRKNNAPVAFISWAFISEEVEERMLGRDGRIGPGEWKSGDRCWIIDVVAPFGGVDVALEELRTKVLSEHKVSLLRLDTKTGKRTIDRLEGAQKS